MGRIQKEVECMYLVAKSIKGLSDYHNVIKSDKYVRKIIEDSVYMEITEYGVCCFIPLDRCIEDIQEEKIPWVYEIEGKLYTTIYTNKYDYLVKTYDISYKQLNLFNMEDWSADI